MERWKHLAWQHKATYPLASTFVEKNLYVDDGLVSVPSVEEAKKLITESQELCKRGGLRLHKFNSNEEAALASLDPSERAATIEPLGLNPTLSERALGIQWSIKTISLQPGVVAFLSLPLFMTHLDSSLHSV